MHVMVAITLWDDTYQGPRFTYGLRYRPLTTGAVPNGWIINSARPHADFIHGTVDYPRRLRQQEVAAFQLELVGETQP